VENASKVMRVPRIPGGVCLVFLRMGGGAAFLLLSFMLDKMADANGLRQAQLRHCTGFEGGSRFA
jgi:hypothetical protein